MTPERELIEDLLLEQCWLTRRRERAQFTQEFAKHTIYYQDPGQRIVGAASDEGEGDDQNPFHATYQLPNLAILRAVLAFDA